MKKKNYFYSVDVNTEGRYDDIWDSDMVPVDFEYDAPMSEDIVIDDAATWLWERFDSDDHEELEEEGIETREDLINSWAWNVRVSECSLSLD